MDTCPDGLSLRTGARVGAMLRDISVVVVDDEIMSLKMARLAEATRAAMPEASLTTNVCMEKMTDSSLLPFCISP